MFMRFLSIFQDISGLIVLGCCSFCVWFRRFFHILGGLGVVGLFWSYSLYFKMFLDQCVVFMKFLGGLNFVLLLFLEVCF